jgi:hypothetical protein
MSDEIDQQPQIPESASPIAPGTPDKHGTPFNPAIHIPKMHPRSGRWMPKGGRTKKPAAIASVTTETTEQTTTAESQSKETAPPAAPSFDDIERAAGPAASDTPAATATVSPSGDAALPAEAAGEIGARAVYAITGAVIGNHKAATASGAEHKNITAVITAYARHRGWAIVGPLALLGTLVAYLLTDGRREPLTDMFKKLFAGKKKPPVSVAAESEPIDITPAAPAAVPSPAESAPLEKF